MCFESQRGHESVAEFRLPFRSGCAFGSSHMSSSSFFIVFVLVLIFSFFYRSRFFLQKKLSHELCVTQSLFFTRHRTVSRVLSPSFPTIWAPTKQKIMHQNKKPEINRGSKKNCSCRRMHSSFPLPAKYISPSPWKKNEKQKNECTVFSQCCHWRTEREQSIGSIKNQKIKNKKPQ